MDKELKLYLENLSEDSVKLYRAECPEILRVIPRLDELETMNDPKFLNEVYLGMERSVARRRKKAPEASLELDLMEYIERNPNFRDNRVGKMGMRRYDWLMKNRPSLLEELMKSGEAEAYLNKVDLMCENRYGTRAALGLIESPTLDLPWSEEDQEHWTSIMYPLIDREERRNLIPEPPKEPENIKPMYPYMLERLKPYPNLILTDYGETELDRLWYDHPETLRRLTRDGKLTEHLISTQIEKGRLEKEMMAEYLEKREDRIPPKDSPEREGYLNMTRLQIREILLRQEDS